MAPRQTKRPAPPDPRQLRLPVPRIVTGPMVRVDDVDDDDKRGRPAAFRWSPGDPVARFVGSLPSVPKTSWASDASG